MPETADANSLLGLLSPGALSTAHQAENIECDGCHKPGNKSAQTELCLACHKVIKRDVDSGRGLHGRHAIKVSRRCNSCHSEHQGPNADIRGAQTLTFDHALTDFALIGAHKAVRCKSCHKGGVEKSAAPSGCSECHKSPHEAQDFPDCLACHDQQSWRAISYRHQSKQFSLSGSHDNVSCVRCHKVADFEDSGRACFECHEIKDVHTGMFGKQCADCHGQNKWTKAEFDHRKKTDFPLLGAHRTVACHACHRFDKALPKTSRCMDCHARNDVHTGANGKRCDDCHNEDRWSIDKYDHKAASGYALLGKHRSVPCALCHKAGVSAKIGNACQDCHRHKDPHSGSLSGDCADCHNERGWDRTRFDHERDTQFPLLHSHSKLRCQACHAAGRTLNKTPACKSCHKTNNVHGEDAEPACDKCHLETIWSDASRFHHDFTDFPLLGMHGLALCEGCHLSKHYSRTKKSCDACHEDKDPHGGIFKAECQSCHNPNAWTSWRFDHADTKFPLEDAHQELQCSDCHSKDRAMDTRDVGCPDCHRKDDVHNGRFGDDCAKCHNGRSFTEVEVDSSSPLYRRLVH